MFRLGGDLQVYLHREPIDFRAGINSLAFLVLKRLPRTSSDGRAARQRLSELRPGNCTGFLTASISMRWSAEVDPMPRTTGPGVVGGAAAVRSSQQIALRYPWLLLLWLRG